MYSFNVYHNDFTLLNMPDFSLQKNINRFSTLLKILLMISIVLGSMIYFQGLYYTGNQSSTTSDQVKEINPPTIPVSVNTGQQVSTNPTSVSSTVNNFQGFVQNTGQVSDSAVKFIASTDTYTIYFETNQILFKLDTSKAGAVADNVLLKFLHSRNIAPSGFKTLPQSSTTSGSFSQPTFQEVWYYNIFPKIDLKYYMTTNGLKYEFIVKPGGNPANIAVQLITPGQVQISDKNILVYSKTNPGALIYSDTGLKTYQGYDQAVQSSFKQVNGETNTYTVTVGSYDKQQLLIIDPYINENPIAIDSNGAFYNASLLYGWNGTGTASSPYLVYNINITSNADNTPGFSVKNTNVYFIILNSYFETNGTNSPSIYFQNVSNAYIINTTFAGFSGATGFSNTGIDLTSASNIFITNNTIESRDNGILVNNSFGAGTSGFIIKTNKFRNNNYGIYSSYAYNLTIDRNNFYNDSAATWVNGQTAKQNRITNNVYNTTSFGYGIYVYSNNTIISNNSLDGFGIGIEAVSTNVTIVGNYVFNSSSSNIYLGQTSNSLITNNTVYYATTGLLVSGSSNLLILHNTIVATVSKGISISGTDTNITIKDNIFTNFTQSPVSYGIYFQTPVLTNFNAIGNSFSGPYYAMFISGVSFANFSFNTFFGSVYGLHFLNSNNNTIAGNTFSSTNYAVDLTSTSSYNIVKNNQMTTGAQGISLTDVNNTLVINNTITGCTYGIVISLQSKLNMIKNNSILSSLSQGIHVERATNNTIIGNSITNGQYGFYLMDANFTVIRNNYVGSNSNYGMAIINSTSISYGNIIKFNDFVNNYPSNPQVYDEGVNNLFLFNYYSDHTNIDSNGDGIADSPYYFAGLNVVGDQKPSVTSIYNTDKILGLQVLYPNGGENLNNTAIITWNGAEDSFGNNNITYNIYYSTDGGVTYVLISSNIVGTSYTWDVSLLNANVYLLKINCTNGLVSNMDLTDNYFLINDALTVPTVISPNGGELLNHTITIIWTASTDAAGLSVTYNVYYSLAGSPTVFYLIQANVSGTSLAWQTYYLVDSSYLIKVVAQNSFNVTASDQSNNSFQIRNILSIIGNSGFASYNIPGAGTIANPYIIQNVNLTSNRSTTLLIENTNAYVIIKLSEFNTMNINGLYGIYLLNATNVIIVNNTILNSYYGIRGDKSLNIRIENNTFVNNIFGVNFNLVNSTIIKTNKILSCTGEDFLITLGNNITVTGNILNSTVSLGAGVNFGGTNNSIITNNIFQYLGSNFIEIGSSHNVNVTGNVFRNYSFHAIVLNTVSGLRISNNSFIDNTAAVFGIFITTGNSLIISNNTFTNINEGIDAFNLTSSTIANNTFVNNTQTAITLSAISNNNLMMNNTIQLSGYYGITINSGLNNVILNNQISKCSSWAIYLAVAANGTKVKFNDLLYNNANGTQVRDQGLNNLFVYNYYSNNNNVDANGDGFADTPYLVSLSSNYDYYPLANPNYFAVYLVKPFVTTPNGGETVTGIYHIQWNASDSNYLFNIVYSVYYSSDNGVSWSLLASGLTNQSLYWNSSTVVDGSNYLIKVQANFGSTLNTYDTSNTVFTVLNNFVHIVLNSPTNNSVLQAGTIIDISVVYSNGSLIYNWDGLANSTVAATFNPVLPAGGGIHVLYLYAKDNGGNWATLVLSFTTAVQAGNIVITSNGDFATYATAGDGSANNPYILEYYNFTLTNMTAIYIANTNSYFILRYNALSGDGSGGIYGIYLFNVTNGVLNNNTISYFESGILVENSTSITIEANTLFANTNAGIYLINSDYCTISSNIIYNNANYGIFLQNSSNNVVDKNEVYLTGVTYVPLLQLMSVTKVNVLIGIGIEVDPSINITLSSNIIYNNFNSGLDLAYTNNSIIKENSIYNNQNNGMEVINSNYNNFENNIIFGNGNGLPFFYNKPSSVNVLIGIGIEVDPSHFNVFDNNTIYGNTITGISLQESNFSSLINNKIFGNGEQGLNLVNSSNNFISDNNVSYNGMIGTPVYQYNKAGSLNVLIGIGIEVDPSFNNIISYNKIFSNGENGIVIQASQGTQVVGNVIYDHPGYGLILDSLTSYTNVTYNEFFNNNPGGTSQAYDDGTNNIFIHNYWSDYNGSGSYSIDGSAGSVDSSPLLSPIQYPLYILFAPIITNPSNRDIISNNVNLRWNPAYDTFNHTILYSVAYSKDGKVTWVLIASNLKNTTYSWDTSALGEGFYFIRITAYERSNSNSTFVSIIILHHDVQTGLSFINSNTKQIPIGDTIEVTYQLRNSFNIAVLAVLSFTFDPSQLKLTLPYEGPYQNVIVPGSSNVSIIFRFDSISQIKSNRSFSLTLTLTKFHFIAVPYQNNWINLNSNSKIELVVYKSKSKLSPGFEAISLGLMLISLGLIKKIKKNKSKNIRRNEQ